MPTNDEMTLAQAIDRIRRDDASRRRAEKIIMADASYAKRTNANEMISISVELLTLMARIVAAGLAIGLGVGLGVFLGNCWSAG